MTVRREPGELIGKAFGIVVLCGTVAFLALFVIGAVFSIANGGDEPTRSTISECIAKTGDLAACPNDGTVTPSP